MDALLKRASLIFDIPEGASLWEVNDGPVIKLPNGDTFWGVSKRPVDRALWLNEASPASEVDVDVWSKKYARP